MTTLDAVPFGLAIIGSTGFVGRRLVDYCLEQRPAWDLRLLVRDSRSHFIRDRAEKLTTVGGDLFNPGALGDLMTAESTVVNLAFIANGSLAENLEAARNLGQACRTHEIRRLVHLSSISVYGDVSGDDVDEKSPCNPCNVYQQTKHQIEKLLMEEARGNFELIILRPGAIFGAHGKNLLKLTDDLIHGNRVLNYLKACLFCNRGMNLVALDNVVAAIVFLIELWISSSPEVFIVSDDDLPGNSYRYVEKKLMKHLNIKAYSIPVIPIPPLVSGLVLKLLRRGESNPRRRYLSDKLSGLGYRKQMSLDQGLMDFVNWYKSTAKTV